MFHFLIALLLLASTLCAQAQTIKASTLLESSPQIDITEAIMREAYQRIGLDLEVQHLPNERALQTVNDGGMDAELYRIEGIEKSYPNLIMVPVPISYTDVVVFAKKNKPIHIEGWGSLRPYKVTYVLGIKAIENHFSNGPNVFVVENYEQGFQMLETEKYEIFVCSRLTGLAVLRKMGLADLMMLEPPLQHLPLYHYLNIKNQHLLKPLTAALKQMEKDGTIRRIQRKMDQN